MGNTVSRPHLIKRVIFSFLILSVVYSLIFFANVYFYILINSCVIAFALYEFYSLLEKQEIQPNKTVGIVLGALLPFFNYFHGEVLVFGAAILILSYLNFTAKTKYSALINTSSTLFGLIYIGLFCSFFSKLRILEQGPQWVAYVITITKFGDAGAYFIGTSFGSIHPFKKISPKKTLEGAIGGLVFSVIGSLAFIVFLDHISFMQLLVLGVLMALIGQAGDLAESLIKRECDVKDSGVIPGLGGILDILDSLFFTAPFLYYYLTILR
jgi:phosphatidate cytidylyltransferase